MPYQNIFHNTLSRIKEALEWAEKQNVDRLRRFLVENSNIPLYCFSSGGSSSALEYAALLYESNRSIAKALTPLMMASISDEALKGAKILIVSGSGDGYDERYTAKRAAEVNPKGTATIVRDGTDNYVIKTLKKVTSNWFVYDWLKSESSLFIATTETMCKFGLFYKAFTEDSAFVRKLDINLNPNACFSYKPKREGKIPELQNIKNYIVLYGGWSKPVATDFECKMIEGGFASVQLADYRNFCHGRFIFISKHIKDSALVLLLTPREQQFVKDLIFEGVAWRDKTDVFPKNTPIVTIETQHDSPLATIDLMIKMQVFYDEVARALDDEPCDPSNPCGIYKPFPRNTPFKGLLEMGALNYGHTQGSIGSMVSVDRKYLINYDPKKSIEEMAKANGVSVPTVRKYIIERRIDRQHDENMRIYNEIWKQYYNDSDQSYEQIAEAVNLSKNTVKLYLNGGKKIEQQDGKIQFVMMDSIITKLREDLETARSRFDRVKLMQAKHPEYDINTILKKLPLKESKENVEQISCFIQMTDFQCKFKNQKIEYIIDSPQETQLPEPTINSIEEIVDAENASFEPILAFNVLDNQKTSEPSKDLKPDLTINDYDIFCLYDFKSANLFDNKKEDFSHCCYFHAEGMYKRYTDNSGFIFAARKHGYKEIEHLYGGVNYRWESNKMYDEYSVSLISMTTFFNSRTNDADMFSVTFRRNNTARKYSGGYKHLYREMADKVKELLGGFDFEKFCLEKTKERLKQTPLPTPIETIKKIAKVKEIKVTEKLDKFLKRNNIEAQKLLKLRDDILAKEAVRTKEYSKSWKPITWDDFGFRKTHIYDTKKIECWSFNSGKDVRDGITLQVGNMVNGFGVSLLGIDFINSEVPYQLAIFKNDEESVKIQKEIADPANPLFRNGLKMKRVYIYNKEYAKYRRDNDFELGNGIWCYEWMKFITWEKVKQNKGFRDILLSIPKNAMIIEQAQKKSHTQWGAWNETLKKDREIVKAAFMAESGKGKTSNVVRNSIYLVNNNSKWEGENAEGQILSMAKLALYEGVNMPIDEQILNSANICWFGKYLCFTKHEDGSVTVNTTDTPNPPSKKSHNHSEGIQKRIK